MPRAMSSIVVVALVVLAVLVPSGAGAATLPAPAPGATAGRVVTTAPSRADVLSAARSALDHFYANNGGATAGDGWRWAPFFMAAEALHRQTGEERYRTWVQAWGDRNAWTADAPTSPTSNPDSRAAIQVWHDAAASGVAADLGPSDRLMAADLLRPDEEYWWIDSLFMGLPLWPRWQERTGDPAYGAKHARVYDVLKHAGTTRWRPGCTATGLFDATEDLWWRDCRYVAQRDALGHKVFWARGNGWVIAAMARTLMVLPASDPQHAEYTAMLRRMAARLAQLQGADGMWRTNLLSPSLHPAPETSATALFAYAMAYGVRAGILDAATYVPVVLAAWEGLRRTALRGSGFLSNCQGVAEAPGTPSTTTSIAYCVGAFGLAATEIAQLDGYLAADSFTRTVPGGLGVAELGGPWAVAAPTTRWAVADGRAVVTTVAGALATAGLDGVALRDADVRVSVGVPGTSSGSVYAAVLARRVGADSYAGRAVVGPTGGVRVQVRRSATTLRTTVVPGLTVRPGDRLWLRVRVSGAAPTTVRVKVWRVGADEPAGWQVQATDGTAGLQAPGTVALSTYLSAGASPGRVAVSWDDVTVRRAG